MRHVVKKTTKRVRELASTAFCEEGYLLDTMLRHTKAEGCSRSILIEGNVVYKLAQGPSDGNHNWSEWSLWNKLPENVRAITAKPLAISKCNMVIAMEYISGGTLRKSYEDRMDADGYYPTDLEKDKNAFNQKLRDLLEKSEKFSKHEIAVMMSDNHASNIAVRANGELCWIDYAG